MKKVIISVLVIILTTYELYAQDVKLGFRGGLNLPNIVAGGSNTPVSEDYKSRLAPAYGIFTELQISPIVSLRFGVEYSGMGGKKDGMQAMPTTRLLTEMGNQLGMSVSEEQIAGLMSMAAYLPQYYYADIKNTVKFDYIMVPILAQFGWNIGQTPWQVYFNVGPFVSFLLTGTQVSDGKSSMFTDASGAQTLWQAIEAQMPPENLEMIKLTFPQMQVALNDPLDFGETNVTAEMKSANFGITGNVGFRYHRNRSTFFIEGGGNFGFITVQKDESNGTNRLGAGCIMLGYSFSMF